MKLAKRLDGQFAEVVRMIHEARHNAIKSINTELVKLYWSIGEYISKKIKSAEWGDAVVDRLADFIQSKHPVLKGFTRRNIYRMWQFYETYSHDEFVSPLVTQIGWSNHLLILSKTKTAEERAFYIKLSMHENYSKRELERQIDSGYYERTMLSKKKVSAVLTQIHPDITGTIKDTYILDFLNLPNIHSEKDLQKSIVANLKDFILEFGKFYVCWPRISYSSRQK